MSTDDGVAVLAVIFVGGLLFGFGLGFSHMARPEVVLDFLQFDDLGLLFVMGGAILVSGVAFAIGVNVLNRAPLTERRYRRRLKELDADVVTGGVVFGLGWGLSGMCPGAAYASFGLGNVTILWGVAGMFVGAYLQGRWWPLRASASDAPSSAD